MLIKITKPKDIYILISLGIIIYILLILLIIKTVQIIKLYHELQYS